MSTESTELSIMSESAGSQSNSAEGDGREAFLCVYVQSFVSRERFTSTNSLSFFLRNS